MLLKNEVHWSRYVVHGTVGAVDTMATSAAKKQGRLKATSFTSTILF